MSVRVESTPSSIHAPGTPAHSVFGRDLLVLALVFGALSFFLLGRAPLANPDEGRYAEIPREMLASGDWITPRLNGVAYFEKPPLVYWAIAGSMAVFGPNEWAIRAVPAVATLAGVLLLYAAMRRLATRDAALGAAIVLGLSVFPFVVGRIVLLDSVVTLLISATLLCFLLGTREPPGRRRRAYFYGSYAAAALATMTKGLIGFLLPGAIVLTWLALFDQWRRLRPFYLPSGLLLFLAIAAPWHVLAAQRNPDWARFYFVHEHWERFTTSVHGRARPWWYFVPLITLGLFPWLGFVWTACRTQFAGGWARRRDNALAGFFAVWAGFVFLFFSASHSKLPPYVLPVFPALSAVAGLWFAPQWKAPSLRLRAGFVVFAVTALLLGGAVRLATLRPELAHLSLAQATALRPIGAVMAVVLVTGSIAVIALVSLGRLRAASSALMATTLLFFGALAHASGYFHPAGTRELALFARSNLSDNATVLHYGDFFHDFVFYARRFVGTVEFHGDEIELGNDAAARSSGRFMDEERFRTLWCNQVPVYVVIRKSRLAALRADVAARAAEETPSVATASGQHHAPPPVLADRRWPGHVLLETSDHLLLTNVPRAATSSD